MKKWLAAVAVSVGLMTSFFLGVKFVVGIQSGPQFAEKKLNNSFKTYIQSIKSVQKLQLAEIQTNEVIERTSKYSIFWDRIQLPEVVVQAQVPVVYSYFVDLKQEFQFELQNRSLIVRAPNLMAAPPSVDISGISYQVKKGSLFRNHQAAVNELNQIISPLLIESAEKNKTLISENAKKELSAFLQTWLAGLSDQKIQFDSIQINFGSDPLP